MADGTGHARAALTKAGVEFDSRDAALFRAIDRTNSIAVAAEDLGRSRARALKRIKSLEDAFGELVERQRGGQEGGGSHLTGTGRELLDRYDRLSAVLAATATVPETVLSGVVTAVEGEMAKVETDVGTLRGLHDGIPVGETVAVRIGADHVTVSEPTTAPEPGATSARNRLDGTVSTVEVGESVHTVHIDVDGVAFQALVTEESRRRLGLRNGQEILILWKATGTWLVREHAPS